MMGRQILIWLLVLSALALAACQGTGDDLADLSVDLTVTPDPPQVGQAAVAVTLRGADGKPVSGAKVDLEGTMTHAGMVPVFAQATEADPGRYEAMLEFTMGGDWVIIVGVALPDGRSLERQFDLPGVKAP